MVYTLWEMITYFIIYSFIGWVIEVSIIAIKEKRFILFSFCELCEFYLIGKYYGFGIREELWLLLLVKALGGCENHREICVS